MDSAEEQILDVVRGFARAELEPNSRLWDEESHFPIDIIRKAGHIGLGGVYVSSELGGSELSRLMGARIWEELAYGDVTISSYLTLHNMVSGLIDTYGTVEQRQQWLPPMCELRILGGYCLTEPGFGSDAAHLETKALVDGDDFVISGTKQFITGGGVAGVYVVMARTGAEGPQGISAFLVPGDSPGLDFGPEEKKMGWRAQPTRQVILDQVRVPRSSLLGEEGQGFAIAMKALNGGRINIASSSLGGARWALDKAIEYAQQRSTFGKMLAEHQTVQFTLADMAIKLMASRNMVHWAAQGIDDNAEDLIIRCASAKKFATDAASEIADQALQLFGGYGYLRDYGIEQVVRDLRVHRILEGANEIMQMIVGRSLVESRAK